MESNTQPFQVIIVGAGLSGLRAAREVHNAGLSYIVLEAMDHVGGKTLSVKASSNGKGIVDLGATWLNDTSQSAIYGLAREFGFDLVEQRVGGVSLYQDHEREVHTIPFGMPAKMEPDQLEQAEQLLATIGEYAERCDLDNPSGGPDAKHLDSITVKDFADQFNDAGASMLINAITRSLLGVESHELSALFVLDILKRGTGLQNVLSDHKEGGQYLRNRQGNQAFYHRLMEGLKPGSVKVSAAVWSITQKDGGCVIETSDGTSYRAEKIIVSVPTPLYPTIRFDPDLPSSKKALSGSTEGGYYSKTVLVFDEPWWHAPNLSGEYSSADGPIAFTRDTCSPADDQYTDERKQTVLRDFRAAFRKVVGNVPDPISVIEKEWTKDEWARGAPGPVMRPGGLTGEAGKSISEPFGNIHFVGTETSPIWRGYMDGAVRSGVRGGKEVIAALDKQAK
ncbi:Amine oxidase [Fusarium sp. LHS14.1]|nr:Amine oxidase [Fusarium sp. LHS14.1]